MALVSAGPVHEHVLKLRAAGGTYASIGRAAGTGAMTVHCIANARRPRVQADVASRLLALSEAEVRSRRPSSRGIMWRLRALVAMGHTCSRMAAATDVSPTTLRRIVRGEAVTISPALREAVVALFDTWWDKVPSQQTRHEKLAARSALKRAARGGWRYARGTGIADDHPIRAEEGRVMKSVRADGSGQAKRTAHATSERTSPAMTEQSELDTSPQPGTRPPEYVIETWVSKQLRDRIQRTGRSLGEVQQLETHGRETDRSPLAEMEAEP